MKKWTFWSADSLGVEMSTKRHLGFKFPDLTVWRVSTVLEQVALNVCKYHHTDLCKF